MDIIANPFLVSVVVMIVMCLLKVNVFLAVLVSALLAGVLGGLTPLETLTSVVEGMSANGSVIFGLLLLGILVAGIIASGLGNVVMHRLAKLIGGKVWLILVSLFLIAIITEIIILIYVAFVPMIAPFMIKIFNKHKIDRRLLVCVIMAGLQVGYVCIPLGFGLVMHGIMQTNMALHGLDVPIMSIWPNTVPIAISMVLSCFIAYFVYRKPREYEDVEIEIAGGVTFDASTSEAPKFERRHIGIILALLTAVVVQSITRNMALGALLAVIVMVAAQGVKWKDFDNISKGGLDLMKYVCFILLAAGGFAEVISEVGRVDVLVDAFVLVIGGNMFLGAFISLLIGLAISMGIGSAWGSIPIFAPFLVPLGLQLGMSPAAVIMLVAASATLGDAGAPASDQVLVTSAAMNMDGNQHDHIRDGCIPSFMVINIPILIICTIAVYIMS